jgi:putative ABC transport system permease protein
MLTDIRFALRSLRKDLTFTITVVLTLALATGAVTAMFAIVEGVLIRPLPYSEPDRLVKIGNGVSRDSSMSHLNFRDWVARSKLLESGAEYRPWKPTLMTDTEAARLDGESVSANLFDVLGVRPVLGRTFTKREEDEGARPVVIISWKLWQDRFGGNPNVIGTSITLTEKPHEIVGVMSQGFYFPNRESELWQPQLLDKDMREGRGNNLLQTIARLKPATTVPQAQSEGRVIVEQLKREYPDNNAGMLMHLERLQDDVVGDTRQALFVLFAAVGALLLLACANIANLMLARAIGRQAEFAIRAALGAARIRLAWQLLTESLVLSVLGGAAGILTATWLLDLLPVFAASLPRVNEVRISPVVAAFSLLITGVTGVLFGLAPALQAARSNFQLFHGAMTGTTATGRSNLPRKLLVVVQTALAVGLLCAAGLLIHSLTRLMRVPTGFDPDQVMTARFNLDTKRYDADAPNIAFCRGLVSKLEAYPQVRRAAIVFGLPMSRQNSYAQFYIVGDPAPDPALLPRTYFHAADANYAAVLGIRMISGRWFDATDSENSEHVAVVNEQLAKKYFGGRDPVGMYLQPRWSLGDRQKPVRIVGVTADMRFKALGSDPVPELFQPLSQFPIGDAFVVVRLDGDPNAAAAMIRTAVRELDPNVALTKMIPMTEIVSGTAAEARFRTLLLATFAGLALVIAVIGIYGVMAHTVAQRRREIGIRLALGAAARDILRVVVGEGATLIAAGIAAGIVIALLAARGMRSILFNVDAADPISLAASAALLMAAGLVAVWIPARRALRVDPVEVLRYE